MAVCDVEKILWGNTDNIWKPVIHLKFDTFEQGKEYIQKDKQYVFSYQHKYNISINIENY